METSKLEKIFRIAFCLFWRHIFFLHTVWLFDIYIKIDIYIKMDKQYEDLTICHVCMRPYSNDFPVMIICAHEHILCNDCIA